MPRRGRYLFAGVAIATAVALLGQAPAARAEGEGPSPTIASSLVPDEAFAACLLRQTDAQELTEDVLAGLTTVSCVTTADAAIQDLTGVAYLTGVTTFRLASTELADVAALRQLPELQVLRLAVPAQVDLDPLAELPKLSTVELTTTPEHDLGFLDGMELDWVRLTATGDRAFATAGVPSRLNGFTIYGPEVTSLVGLEGWSAPKVSLSVPKLADLSPLEDSRIDWLMIAAAQVRDLHPVAGIEGLTRLWLIGLPLSDVGPLASLDSLEFLDLSSSAVADLSPLAGMPSLASLIVRWTAIPEISVAVTMPSLTALDISFTAVTELGPPGSLAGLVSLAAERSQVESLEGLRGATRLSSINLSDARIRDISPLADLPEGATLNLDRNRIHDFSPLAGWTGKLTAIGQEVTLPDVVAETSYPVALLDETGKPLRFRNGETVYRDGALHYPTGAAMWFDLANATVPATITVTLRQNVLSGKAFTKTRPATISGAANSRVGRKLTVSVPAWTPAATWYTYYWVRDGLVIAGATGSSYTPTSADYDTSLQVYVTGHRDGYNAAIVHSGYTDYVRKGYFASTPAPRITGTRAVGSTLTATVAWSPKPSTISYQWYRNGHKIKKATKRTYTLTAADKGKRITVKATGKKRGYYTHSRTSARTLAIAKGTMATPAARITGTPGIGRVLTAVHGAWGPSGVKFSYQWYRDGRPIKKATAKTHRVVGADLGHGLTVRITGKKSGYATSSRTSPVIRIT